MKILVVSPFNENAFLQIRALPGVDAHRCTQPQELLSRDLSEFEALLIRTGVRVDGEFLKRTPKLKFLFTCTIGFDHLDLDALSAKGIVASHAPHANTASTAELTWLLILATQRRLVESHRAVKAGAWRHESLRGTEVAGKTLGIVGLGRIGQRVAQMASSFQMNVLAYDPYQDDEVFTLARRGSFEEVLMLSDIVSFHVPATAKTKHMLSATQFDGLKPGATIINTSRGSVIHPEDLLSALEKGQVRAAGLDVFEKEPLTRESPLLKMHQVVLSPHVGGFTYESLEKSSWEAVEKLRQFLRSGTCEDVLPPKYLWYEQRHDSF